MFVGLQKKYNEMEKRLFRVDLSAKTGCLGMTVTVYVLAPSLSDVEDGVSTKYPKEEYSINWIQFIDEEFIVL